MQYCIYLRKSRADVDAEARGEGETLARHEKILIDLAKSKELNITKIHREIVSGETITSRPVMQKLLREVEQGLWDGVLVMEVERLARGDTVDQGVIAQAFKYSGTNIITPIKTYNTGNEFDEEYFEFGLFMSRREYKAINRRIQAGRIAAVREGKWVANRAPYGYRRIQLEKEKGWTLKIDEKEADVVRMVFEYYTIGEKQEDGSMLRIGPTKIARKLDNLKIQPQKGTEWSTSTIRDMLTNPVYIGMVRWNQRARVKSMSNGQISTSRPRSKNATLAKGLHPAIIQKDTFDLAQEYIEKNPVHPAPSSYQLKNPLSGIVKCGVCGRAMARRPYQKKGKPATLMCPSTSCTNVSVALPLVEERILAGLRDWLSGYILELGLDNETDAVHKKDVMKKSLSDLAKKRGTLQKQLNKAHELLEQEVYTIETFIERSKSVSDDITEIDKTVLAIEKEIALDKAREDSKKNIVPMIENVLDVYDSLPTPTGKNNILKEILEKVVYVKKEECRWNSPDNFEITLFPKLPYAK